MKQENITAKQFKFGTKNKKRNKYPVKRCKKCKKPLREYNKSNICTNCFAEEDKEESDSDKRYIDMSNEEKNILKKYGLFYYKWLSRWKVARALLIQEDEIKRLEKIIIKIKKK